MIEIRLDGSGEAGRWGVANLPARVLGQIGPHVEARDAGGSRVPVQLDRLPDGTAELVADLAEAASGLLRLDRATEPAAGSIGVDTVQSYEGQETYRIQTADCTWYYHKQGAGFASLIDADGNDWISFRPWGGSDGIYRGIPNLAHPENVFHPGAQTCRTAPVRVGPLRATIASESKDGAWSCVWHIYPDHAELTVLKVGHPYWLLYEGTPAGVLDEERDFTIRSDGLRRAAAEAWDEVLPDPKWVAFGKEGVERCLWLQSHEPRNAGCRDSYWPMERNMTVFGFGRLKLDKFMTAVPARFTVGLCDSSDRQALGAEIARRTRRIELSVDHNSRAEADSA